MILCVSLENKTLNNPMAGYLSSMLGMRIPEEAYQCGKLPTRAVLDLYDYVDPTDSDVAACMFLCNKIEVLERAGMLNREDMRLSASKKELAQAFQSSPGKIPRPQKPPQITEEEVEWDFGDDSE